MKQTFILPLILFAAVVFGAILVMLSRDSVPGPIAIPVMNTDSGENEVFESDSKKNNTEEVEEEIEKETEEIEKDVLEEGAPLLISKREVQVTDGVKHTVPLREILGGGPVKDGIPSIDEPIFESVSDAAEWLDDDDIGILINMDGVVRYYPFPILVRHEIVNDVVKGKRVLVTYCPLCLSGIVFDPVVGGERVEFGTSGKLWNSNLVMYDRKSDTYWSQVLGEAIKGEFAGASLAVLPSDQIQFSEIQKSFPSAEVLSRKAGSYASFRYSSDPYGDYYTTNDDIYFPLNNVDNRLENKDFVLGILIDGKTKAYYPPAIKAKGEIEDAFAGKTLIVRYESSIDAVRIFEKKADGELERINPFANFWFSWVAVHPDTELYK